MQHWLGDRDHQIAVVRIPNRSNLRASAFHDVVHGTLKFLNRKLLNELGLGIGLSLVVDGGAG